MRVCLQSFNHIECMTRLEATMTRAEELNSEEKRRCTCDQILKKRNFQHERFCSGLRHAQIFVRPFVCNFFCVCVCVSENEKVCLSVCLPVCLPGCLFAWVRVALKIAVSGWRELLRSGARCTCSFSSSTSAMRSLSTIGTPHAFLCTRNRVRSPVLFPLSSFLRGVPSLHIVNASQ